MQSLRIKADKKNIFNLWDKVKKIWGIPLPPEPNKSFINFVMTKLYDDSIKPGEKINHEYFAKCFGMGLEKIYGLHLKK